MARSLNIFEQVAYVAVNYPYNKQPAIEYYTMNEYQYIYVHYILHTLIDIMAQMHMCHSRGTFAYQPLSRQTPRTQVVVESSLLNSTRMKTCTATHNRVQAADEMDTHNKQTFGSASKSSRCRHYMMSIVQLFFLKCVASIRSVLLIPPHVRSNVPSICKQKLLSHIQPKLIDTEKSKRLQHGFHCRINQRIYLTSML